ncbi:MAG: AbrB/MazE/SpoVT family DNA-binding domain-containing protein [Deltaproteobacteria bacterium]|nr:AbrB/MazE/SpoVT family DNA-binding domain-containing protein [Deltaproteobacteria bacterium]
MIKFTVGKMIKMSELLKIGKKAQIVIPKKIRNQINIKEGDEILIDAIDNSIIITLVPKDISEFTGIAKGIYPQN